MFYVLFMFHICSVHAHMQIFHSYETTCMNKSFVNNQYMSNSFKKITFDKNIKIYIESFISKKRNKIWKKEIINIKK